MSRHYTIADYLTFHPEASEHVDRTLGLIREQGCREPPGCRSIGGCVDNIRRIAAAGADTFVTGTAFFDSPDYAAIVSALRAELALASF